MLWQKQTSKVRRKRLTGRYASESMVRETFLRRWHWNEWGSDLRKDPGKAIPGEENIKRKGLKRPVGEIVSVCTRVEWVGHQRGLGTKAAGTDYIEPSKPSSGLWLLPRVRGSHWSMELKAMKLFELLFQRCTLAAVWGSLWGQDWKQETSWEP